MGKWPFCYYSIMGIFARFLANLAGLFAAVKLVNGFSVQGGIKGYLISAAVLVILNLLVKPILKLLTLPLIIISLGLFILVINGLILWMASQFTDYIIVSNLMVLFWVTIIMTVANLIAARV